MSDLEGRTVLVVGAGGGIGSAIVTSCRDAGARVLHAELPGVAVSTVGDEPVCRVDLADVDAACATLAAFAADHGPLDGLVNAAGVTQRTCFPDVPTVEFRRILDVDLVAPAQLVQALAPHLRSPGGAVVNVTSQESEIVIASQGLTTGAYAAAKAGLRLATMCHAVDLGRRGIRVNAVAPGFIETPMAIGVIEASGDWLRAQTPLGRTGRPSDVGPPVVFLLSDGAGFITGETLNIGGGMGLGEVNRTTA